MRARKRSAVTIIDFAELRRRSFRRAVILFRLEAAARLRSCIGEVMLAQEAADEALATRLDEMWLDRQGLAILGRPIRSFIHSADP